MDDFFRNAIHAAQAGWRKVVAKAAELGVPAPAFSSAPAYYDGYRSSHLAANLLQTSGTISEHTLMSVSTSREANFSTPIGPVTVAKCRQVLMKFNYRGKSKREKH